MWLGCWYDGDKRDYFDGADVAHILVDNGRIYMCGSVDYNQKAFYRVNKTNQPFEEDLKHSKASAIFVQDNQVYGGGSYYYYDQDEDSETWNACYWDGDGRHDLESDGDESEVKSIFVYGNQVYTAGFVGKNACYWIGTKRYKLDNEESGATCILVR